MIEWLALFLFAVLFSLVAWYRLPWAVALTLFLTPAYQLRFHIGPLPSTYLEVMLVLLMGVWVVQTTFRHAWKAAQWPWRWLTISFILAGIVAVAVSLDTRAGLGLWKAYILEPILFFYVFVNVVRSRDDIRRTLIALGMSVVVIGLVALLQYTSWLPIPEPYASESPIRATGVFEFPTAVGKYVAPIVGLFLGLLLGKRNQAVQALRLQARRGKTGDYKGQQGSFGRMFLVGVVVFGFIALMLSFSRAALVGVFAALLFVSFFSQWKKWIWIALAAALMILIIVPQTRTELGSVVSGQDVSTDVHLVMWKGTLRLIQDRPIFGAGLAGFPIMYEQYKEASHTEFFPNPDHLILTLWAEMGLAGLIVFTWIVVKYFMSGFKKLFALRHKLLANGEWHIAYNQDAALIVGLCAAMIATIVHGFFDTPYFKNDLALIFWACIGIMVVSEKLQHS